MPEHAPENARDHRIGFWPTEPVTPWPAPERIAAEAGDDTHAIADEELEIDDDLITWLS